MIEKLTYTNERGESVIFSTKSIYHVNISKDVTGLSDVRNSIFSSSSMGQDGDTFLGQRIIARDIDIIGHIHETDKAKAAELRRWLLHVLNPHYAATLVYELGEFKRVIDCRADSSPAFRAVPVLQRFTVQLSCSNPFWREEAEKREDIASWIGLFEFPEPEGLEIDDSAGMEFEQRAPDLIVNVQNTGDVTTGLTAVLRASGSVTNPSLINAETLEFIKLDVVMQAGDVITISTGYGQKRATMRRGGEDIDMFRHLDADSTYLQLAVGNNFLRYDAEAHLDSLDVSIFHSNLYLGI